jgi:lysozyme family protein
MMSFDHAFEFVIGVEKGLIDDAYDPGGLTNFGISHRAYPDEDIRAMTLERSKLLYKRDYWDKIRGDEMPQGLALCVFDFAVNSGVSEAIKALQRALEVTADGLIGSQTLLAIQRFSPRILIEYLQAERVIYMAELPTWKRFRRGWARRVVSGAIEAA